MSTVLSKLHAVDIIFFVLIWVWTFVFTMTCIFVPDLAPSVLGGGGMMAGFYGVGRGLGLLCQYS